MVAQQGTLRANMRNRLYFILGLILLLSIGGFFAHLTVKALYVRSVTSSVFNKYVIDHHIGNAQISDDASGFQGDFCVLQLNQPIPANSLEEEASTLAYEYHDLDGGTILSMKYLKGGKSFTEADTVYDESTQTLTINMYDGAEPKTLHKHVDWQNGADAS